MATLTDPGKLMQAKLPGTCAECGGDIQPRDTIYFSRTHGSRHKRCVEPGEAAPPPAADRERAPRDAAPPARDLFAARDDSPAAVGWPPDDATRRDDEPRAARATEFGQVLDLIIEAQQKHTEALQRIRRVLG